MRRRKNRVVLEALASEKSPNADEKECREKKISETPKTSGNATIWLTPKLNEVISPYVSTTVQKLSSRLWTGTPQQRLIEEAVKSSPTILESLYAEANSKTRRRSFAQRFPPLTRTKGRSVTVMYQELLREHQILRAQLRDVFTPEFYNRMLVLRQTARDRSDAERRKSVADDVSPIAGVSGVTKKIGPSQLSTPGRAEKRHSTARALSFSDINISNRRSVVKRKRTQLLYARDTPSLELDEVQIGPWRVKNALKNSIAIEFESADISEETDLQSKKKGGLKSTGDGGMKMSSMRAISVIVRFPENLQASQHIRALMPVTSTFVIMSIGIVWSAFAIHKSFIFLSLALAFSAFRSFLQSSPFAPYRGELRLRILPEDICGFRYLNRLTETGILNIELKKLTMSWKPLKHIVEPESPRVCINPSQRKVKTSTKAARRLLSKKGQTAVAAVVSPLRYALSVRRRLESVVRKKHAVCLQQRDSLRRIVDFACAPGTSSPKNQKDARSNKTTTTIGASPQTMEEHRKESKAADETGVASIWRWLQPQTFIEGKIPKDVITMKNQMITVKFEEPLIPPLLKKFVLENEQVIPHCESGLPGWSVFLVSYGLFYRREMRHLFVVGVWLASLVMMAVGIFDLFRTFPAVRSLFAWLLGNWFAWFEEAIVLRAASVLTFLLPQAALNFLWVLQSMWRAASKLVSVLLYAFQMPITVMRTLAYVVMGILRPIFHCCSRIGAIGRAASPAVQASPTFFSVAWSAVVKIWTLGKFIWNLFRNIVLNGISRIGIWVLQHWTSFHRFFIERYFRSLVIFGGILLLFITHALWHDD